MFAIVANVKADRVLRTGAKVWIMRCNGDAECPVVLGLNKSGRAVVKYTHFKRLENYRAAWVPEHMRDRIARRWNEKAKAEAEAHVLAGRWAGVRFFNCAGTVLLQDGISTEQAFRRAALAP